MICHGAVRGDLKPPRAHRGFQLLALPVLGLGLASRRRLERGHLASCSRAAVAGGWRVERGELPRARCVGRTSRGSFRQLQPRCSLFRGTEGTRVRCGPSAGRRRIEGGRSEDSRAQRVLQQQRRAAKGCLELPHRPRLQVDVAVRLAAHRRDGLRHGPPDGRPAGPRCALGGGGWAVACSGRCANTGSRMSTALCSGVRHVAGVPSALKEQHSSDLSMRSHRIGSEGQGS